MLAVDAHGHPGKPGWDRGLQRRKIAGVNNRWPVMLEQPRQGRVEFDRMPGCLVQGYEFDIRAAHPIAEIEPSDLVEDWGLVLPAEVAVFHVKRDPKRSGLVHRFPNMLAWTERLPTRVRVVVLDLDVVTQLDHDAVMELRATLRTMQARGRTMLISGLTDSQVQELREAGVGELLDPSVVCQDLELAIARAITLTQG